MSFLFMGGETNVIRSEIAEAIKKMMSESKATPTSAKKNLEVSVIGDIMQINQTNVTINIDANPFEISLSLISTTFKIS